MQSGYVYRSVTRACIFQRQIWIIQWYILQVRGWCECSSSRAFVSGCSLCLGPWCGRSARLFVNMCFISFKLTHTHTEYTKAFKRHGKLVIKHNQFTFTSFLSLLIFFFFVSWGKKLVQMWPAVRCPHIVVALEPTEVGDPQIQRKLKEHDVLSEICACQLERCPGAQAVQTDIVIGEGGGVLIILQGKESEENSV